jgi:hypothetical protein
MKTSLRVFALALLLSVLVHLAMLGSGLLPDAVIELPPDQALRKIDVKMQALALDTPAPPAVPTARLLPVGPAGGAVASSGSQKAQAQTRCFRRAGQGGAVADKAAEHPPPGRCQPASHRKQQACRGQHAGGRTPGIKAGKARQGRRSQRSGSQQ